MLRSKTYRHLLLLLYWPVYLLLFIFVERANPTQGYHLMHCALDDHIPFCEAFLLPYMLWYVLLAGATVYTLLYDVDTFKRYMKYIALTYTTAIAVYLVYPTGQNMRPAVFPRDNLLTRCMALIYQADTSTNVCPSIHVLGALGVWFAARRTKAFSTPRWKFIFGIVTLLVCLSTVFLKQHSILDVLWALPLSLLGYGLFFRDRCLKIRHAV